MVQLPKRGRMRRWTFRALVVLVSVGIAIAVIDVGLLVFAPTPYHELMRFVADGHVQGRAEPGLVLHTADGHEIRINRLGFRGPDRDWHPKPGTLRLIALGGSSTFNYHASGEANTWPSRLETHLRDALKMKVEVINLGMPGYDLSNSKINYLFTGRSLHPHVVVVYHTWNDMAFLRDIDQGIVLHAAPVKRANPWWYYLARESQICRRVRNALFAHYRNTMEQKYRSWETGNHDANAPVSQDAYAWFERNFRDMVSFAESDAVLPVLVTQATIVKPENQSDYEYRRLVGVQMQQMTMPRIHETWTECNQIIANVAAERSAIFIDAFSEVPSDLDHLQDSVHLTDKGRDVLASSIADGLVSDQAFQEVVQRVKESASSGNVIE